MEHLRIRGAEVELKEEVIHQGAGLRHMQLCIEPLEFLPRDLGAIVRGVLQVVVPVEFLDAIRSLRLGCVLPLRIRRVLFLRQPSFLHLLLDFLLGLLQKRVLLHLLAQLLHQLQPRELQEADRLLQHRRHDHSLGLEHPKSGIERHGTSVSFRHSEKRSPR